MTFNSVWYFLFLLGVFAVFHATKDRWRWVVLLLSSYGFYAYLKAPYLLGVLLLVTGVSYFCGLRIAAARDERHRRVWLWTGIAACVAILTVMKYLSTLLRVLGPAFGSDGLGHPVLVSIGVSYYTFQAISYLVDVHLEVVEPEEHFGYYALHMALFAKLLQGPIERAGNLICQLKRPYRFDSESVRAGLLLFAGGLFKKVVIADRAALYADRVYDSVHDFSGLALLTATYAFAVQIYFDFSGYTDMARGSARLFGITLTENFNRPYLATSIPDFWRRWHMSFSNWLSDYLFRPLQIRFRDWSRYGTVSAIGITFLVCGLWHGVAWGFLIWGLLHGLYMATSFYYRPYQKRVQRRLRLAGGRWHGLTRILLTFNLVAAAWVFFRAATLQDAWYVWTHVFDLDVGGSLVQTVSNAVFLGLEESEILLLMASIGFWLLYDRIVRTPHVNGLVRWCAYAALLLATMNLGVPSGHRFIYFRF